MILLHLDTEYQKIIGDADSWYSELDSWYSELDRKRTALNDALVTYKSKQDTKALEDVMTKRKL